MKQKKRLISILLLISCLLPGLRGAAYSGLPEVDIQSRSAILVHAQTDEVLFGHNIHIRREPASITKIMTALLALEYEGQDETVTAEAGDFFDIITIHQVQIGEEFVLRDLLYYIMVSSNNEACNMIARHIAGSVEAFMERVNLRLAELGCENTRFTNPHGLPDPEHYTTAYEIYLMVRECLNNPSFMDIANTEYIVLPPTNLTPEGRALITTNNLITRRRNPEYIYPFARGVKTGRTNNAGHCLTSTAEQDGITLISVVLGAVEDEDTGQIRSFTETRDLFIWGFEHFTVTRILSSSDKLVRVNLAQGLDQDHVLLTPETSVEALIPKYLAPEDIHRQITVYDPDGLRAPVSRGDVLGEVRLTYEGRDYGTIPLVADRSVERDTREVIQDNLGNVFDRIFGRIFGRLSDEPDPPGSGSAPSGARAGTTADLEWIFWAVVSAAALVAFYVLYVIHLNRRRRNMRASNYRGRRRY
ncbi:MAG: D-alanyl-D-alanine carboxypeptidase [Oscillospiraceae bacterium]|nr:D-alanyl-D-alanine carboxypeptidase [Oscillospiraceae bacterium]